MVALRGGEAGSLGNGGIFPLASGFLDVFSVAKLS